MKIAIIDYGMGNLASVKKTCISFGAQAKIVQCPEDLDVADKIILPGVGAFGDAMHELKKLDLGGVIKDKISRGLPFLGICLGMQLLFDSSEEGRAGKGLGILRGKVQRFRNKNMKVPHIGWNNVNIKYQISKIKNKGRSLLLRGIKDNSYVYFCHSYYVKPEDRNIIAAMTDYGETFASVVSKDNVFGIQFHPEKSQKVGLKILENFINL